MQETVLGTKFWRAEFLVKTSMGTEELVGLAGRIVDRIGMERAGAPAVWEYPLPSGKGGLGATICYPLVESFITMDTWPDHHHVLISLCSCKRFKPLAVFALIKQEVGTVLASKTFSISADGAEG